MLTMTDLFCGAGGSSSGAIQVPGVRVRMAANHWDLAVRTHNTNHPDADHDCADISQADPRRYPHTDLLWASPECTNHSQAKGRRQADSQPDLLGLTLPDAAAERSRATMWDVIRFAEHHRYAGIIVENVVEVRRWTLWPAWSAALDVLGYDFRTVYLNSMFAQAAGPSAPQSRDRVYIVAWKRGNRAPDFSKWTRPYAWCATCDRTVRAVQAWKRPEAAGGRYRQQYIWRCPSYTCRNTPVEPAVLPASSVIDWSVLGTRIGDRDQPLAARTMARIRAGLRKYGRHLAVPVEGRDGVNARALGLPLRTQTGRNETAVVAPAAGSDALAERPLSPISGEVNEDCRGLLVPAGGTWNDAATLTTAPFRTRTTRDTEGILMPPALLLRNQNSRGGQMCTPVDEPIRTVMSASRQSLIVMPWMVVDYNGPARPVAAPLPTQTTVEGDGVCSIENTAEDCLFRMLSPREIQGAMAFDPAYEVHGNKREQVRQLGNAVTPPAARDLIAALAESITGDLAAAI